MKVFFTPRCSEDGEAQHHIEQGVGYGYHFCRPGMWLKVEGNYVACLSGSTAMGTGTTSAEIVLAEPVTGGIDEEVGQGLDHLFFTGPNAVGHWCHCTEIL